MKPRNLAAATIALVLHTAPSHAEEMTKGMAMDHATVIGTSKEYRDAMAAMDQAMAAMPMTGEPGRDFAAMMIPHHQAAIEMAESYLKSGDGDPILQKMSNDIIAAQEREIGILNAWLTQRGR